MVQSADQKLEQEKPSWKIFCDKQFLKCVDDAQIKPTNHAHEYSLRISQCQIGELKCRKLYEPLFI